MMQKDPLQKIIWQCYAQLWHLVIPFLRLNHRLAEGFEQRTLRYTPQASDIWIQAASAGEAYLAELLLKNLTIASSVRTMVTSNTRQGIEILEQSIRRIRASSGKKITVNTAYFPFDSPVIMERAVQQIGPKVMVLLETEIWPGLLSALKRKRCRILIINARLGIRSLKRYQIYPSLWEALRPDQILAVSHKDARHFAALFGSQYVKLMPNMKFDRFDNTASEPAKHRLSMLSESEKPFIVLGSVGEKEETDVEKMLFYLCQNVPEAIIGLFPRHLHRISCWQNVLNRLGISWILRSEMKKIRERRISQQVILWDTFGELQSAYTMAKAAFVGGSLAPMGGQNFLEALACGVVPVIGPFWDTFEWVGREIIREGLLCVAQNWKDAADALITHLKKQVSHDAVRKAAFRYIQARQGGTKQACRLIQEVLNSQGAGMSEFGAC